MSNNKTETCSWLTKGQKDGGRWLGLQCEISNQTFTLPLLISLTNLATMLRVKRNTYTSPSQSSRTSLRPMALLLVAECGGTRYYLKMMSQMGSMTDSKHRLRHMLMPSQMSCSWMLLHIWRTEPVGNPIIILTGLPQNGSGSKAPA